MAQSGFWVAAPRLECEAQRSIEGFGFVPRVPLAGDFVDAQRDAFVVAGLELLEKVAGVLSELGPLIGADAEPDAVLQGRSPRQPGEDLNASIAGQTGDEGATPWTPGGASDNTDCGLDTNAEPLASLDAASELGFSANDILAFAGGDHEANVRWNARPVVSEYLDYLVQVTPGDLDERLRVALAPDGSPPRFRAHTFVGVGADAGVPAYCRGQLELDVTVELRSDSGAIDERWRGTLTASDASEARLLLQAPTWRGRLPRQPDRDEGYFLNAQEGSLDAVDERDPGSVLAWVDVWLRFRSGAIDGSVNGWVQTADGGAFLMPQLADQRDSTGWLGVIGDGHYGNVWGVE